MTLATVAVVRLPEGLSGGVLQQTPGCGSAAQRSISVHISLCHGMATTAHCCVLVKLGASHSLEQLYAIRSARPGPVLISDTFS